MAEAADPYAASALVEEIQAAMKAYFELYGYNHQYRDIIGVGYSGGFIPLIETLAHPGYFAKTLIALGAATIRPEAALQDLLVKIMEAADYLSNPSNVATSVIVAALENLDLALVGLLGVGVGKGLIEQIAEFIAQETPKEAYNQYMSRLGELGDLIDSAFDGSTLDNLTVSSPNTQMIVNVYGTKDILSELKVNGVSIGGYRDEIGGFAPTDRDHALVNIEIVGASHFDYTRREVPGANITDLVEYSLADKEWNKEVSIFVAKLISNSQSQDQLERFLVAQKITGVAFQDSATNKWTIYLPGWDKHD